MTSSDPTPDRATHRLPGRDGAPSDDLDHDGPGGGHALAASAGYAAMLAPFVAWLATQQLDEPTRRRHREAVEAYLTWRHTHDDGPASGSRRRYEGHLDQHDPDLLDASRAGLDHFAQYRTIVARTLPIDGR